MDAIHAIAKKYKLKVIEDAAHALPSMYKGKKGVFIDITHYRGVQQKHWQQESVNNTTDNADYALSMKRNRLHGISKRCFGTGIQKRNWYYEVVIMVINTID